MVDNEFDKFFDRQDCWEYSCETRDCCECSIYQEALAEYEKEQRNSGQELLQLVKENPDLPIVPMVDFQIGATDEYRYWLGSWGRAAVDEYVCVSIWGEERFITRNEQVEIEEYFESELLDEHPELTDEEIEKQAHEKAEALSWVKASIVYIDLPEVP